MPGDGTARSGKVARLSITPALSPDSRVDGARDAMQLHPPALTRLDVSEPDRPGVTRDVRHDQPLDRRRGEIPPLDLTGFLAPLMALKPLFERPVRLAVVPRNIPARPQPP